MEFMVSLIKVEPTLDPSINEEVAENCTHIKGDYFFFEGDLDSLKDMGATFEVIEECMFVESLGGLTEEELVELSGLDI